MVRTSSTLNLNTKLIDDFISRYAGFQGPISEFWSTLSQDSEFTGAVPELQLTLQLGTLTLGNPPLVAALRAHYPQMKSPRILASLSATDWQQLITSQNIAAPTSISGVTSAERASNYASAIVGTLKAAFPGAYFARDLQVAANNTVDQTVATFLNNTVDFDILDFESRQLHRPEWR